MSDVKSITCFTESNIMIYEPVLTKGENTGQIKNCNWFKKGYDEDAAGICEV